MGNPFQNVSILDCIAAKDDGGGDDNWSYKMYKAPVKSSPPTYQYPAFYRPDALHFAVYLDGRKDAFSRHR